MRSERRAERLDPGLLGLWSTGGDIIRIASDTWQYSLDGPHQYVISPDGLTLTFPSTSPVAVYQRVFGSGPSIVGVWLLQLIEAGVTWAEEVYYRQDGTYTSYWTADGVYDSEFFGIYSGSPTVILREERRALVTTSPPDQIDFDVPFGVDASGTYAIDPSGNSWTLTLGGVQTVYFREPNT